MTQKEHKKKKKSTFGGRSKETRTSYRSTPIHTTVTSGKDILLEAQHDMTIRAPKLKSEGATTFVSHDGKVTMAAPKAVYVSTQTKKSKSAVWQSQQSKGRVGEEVSLAKILAKGGFIALASQASVFLLNNEGDIGKTFADLGRTESLTSLAISIASARLLEGLYDPLGLPAQPTSVLEHLHVNAVQTGVSTSLAVPFQGADLVESLTDGVLATALNTATGYASTQIGQARVGEIGERGGKKVLVSGGLDGFTHKLLHALNGAALGVAVSRGKDVVANAAAGAIGSVGAELIGEYLMEDGIWLVSFMQFDLGYFDEDSCRVEPLDNPFREKLLPMSSV